MNKGIFVFLLIFAPAILSAEPVETRFTLGALVLGAKQSAYTVSSDQVLKELRIRTHIDPKDQRAWKWLTEKTIDQSPPFLWLIIGNRAKSSPELIASLQRFVFSGGTVLVEAERGAQAQFVLENLRKKVFYKRKVSIVQPKELITRTYYILPESTAKLMKTVNYADRILWVESSTPILTLIKPHYSTTRETAIRTAVNVVLYTLTGSYKDDLTHLKYLMRRKKH
jgi:hypothetical protein